MPKRDRRDYSDDEDYSYRRRDRSSRGGDRKERVKSREERDYRRSRYSDDEEDGRVKSRREDRYRSGEREERERGGTRRERATAEYEGYSNTDNPFGDSDLEGQFVWKKRAEQDAGRKLSDKEAEKQEKRRRTEATEELQKAKQKREERELEHMQWEEEQRRLNREREAAQYGTWEKKEVEFHLQQAKRRAQIRIAEGRAKPIDILYKNVTLSTEFDLDTTEPYCIFDRLSLQELQDLKDDIHMYFNLDPNKQFWSAMLVVCDDELAKHYKRQEGSNRRDDGVHASIDDDVASEFEGKSISELDEMEQQIQATLQGGSGVIDVEFWEGLLRRLKVVRAKTILKQLHKDLLRKRLSLLREEQSKVQQRVKREGAQTSDGRVEEVNVKEEHWDPFADDDFEVVGLTRDDDGVGVLQPSQAAEQLRTLRSKALEAHAKAVEGKSQGDDEFDPQNEDHLMWMEQNQVPMEEDEELFAADDLIVESKYGANDKFRPRKPKYFNRVRTGYDWNKYNQTHYDEDNPPPKVVQGYKFNIFYPDLINKAKAPTFHIKKTDNPDTVVIRFHAGPPYEDIAFKILNRPWDYGNRMGYKCVFDRGILHLWFNFKKYRYRR